MALCEDHRACEQDGENADDPSGVGHNDHDGKPRTNGLATSSAPNRTWIHSPITFVGFASR